MPRILAVLLCVSMLAVNSGNRANAGALSEPTDCFIDNPNPTVAVGVQASYIVQLSGGNGSYSVTLSYGDGSNPDSQSTSSTTASFAHYFASPGVFTQTANVASAGSSARCTTTTSVQ
jgi:hypothetical protein